MEQLLLGFRVWFSLEVDVALVVKVHKSVAFLICSRLAIWSSEMARAPHLKLVSEYVKHEADQPYFLLEWASAKQ